jgi:hypothetical protein
MSRYNALLKHESAPADEPQPGRVPSPAGRSAATRNAYEFGPPAALPNAQASSPIVQSTDRSTDQSTGFSASRIVARPKAFYITERLDARLDEAVRYLQTRHGIRKVDRSTIVNAMLDQEANWNQEALDALVDRVLGQLTSRLTG